MGKDDVNIDDIIRAANALKNGNLVAFPTETVYGLGADATNEQAVSRVFSVKARPISHPLIVHILSFKQLDNWANYVPNYAIRLAKEFWPGPMTLILKKSNLAKDFLTGGQNSIGLRVPANDTALKLLEEFAKLDGDGIAAPSANRFGAVSATSSADVIEEIGEFLERSDMILNGGSSHIGIESTIIDCTNKEPIILRPGAVTREMVENTLNMKITSGLKDSQNKFSGSFRSHYSPQATIKLYGPSLPGYGFIALASIETPIGSVRLASPKDVNQYAREIYSAFRLGDNQGIKTIIVIPPEGGGITEAINDRLLKASYR